MVIHKRFFGCLVFLLSFLVFFACKPDDLLVEVTFESNGGNPVSVREIAVGERLDLPAVSKEGHTFFGWFSDEALSTPHDVDKTIEENMTLYAKWHVNQYVITFETNGGETMNQVTRDYGTLLFHDRPSREDYAFAGWYLEETHDTHILRVPAMDVTVYAKWGVEVTDMVSVGQVGTTYEVPINIDDRETATVHGGFLMATTETTYELWYDVRLWAEENGYVFQNFGLPGSHDDKGNPWGSDYPLTPRTLTDDNRQQPVTRVSWVDVVVWLNALSEMAGFDPVYRTLTGEIIKDSREANARIVDDAIQTGHYGYRLPTSNEWEMAARWRNSDGDGSILVGQRYWTPGTYASGSTAPVWEDFNFERLNEAETRAVAWFSYGGDHPNNHTRPVGLLSPNHLGLYDMSGNVTELVFDAYRVQEGTKITRGGGYVSEYSLSLGYSDTAFVTSNYSGLGFRLARGPYGSED